MLRRVLRAVLLPSLAVLLVACQGDSPTSNNPPSGPKATSITISPDSLALVANGDTARFTAVVRDQNGNAMAGQTVAWSSSDSGVATVSSEGLVSGAKAGTATVSASLGSLKAERRAIVAPQKPTRVSVSPDSLILPVGGDTARLTATVKDQRGNPMSGAPVTWRSSDTTVAKISPAGLVTTVKPGTATLSATVDALTATSRAIVKLQMNARCTVPGTFPVRPAVGPVPSFVPERSAIRAPYGAAEAVVLDVDKDGRQDVVIFTWDPPNEVQSSGQYRGVTHVWRNNGLGNFVDATTQVLGGLTIKADNPRHWEVADFNGDGRLDVFLGQHGDESAPHPDQFPGAPNLLLIQQSDGTLRDEAATRLNPYDRNSYTHGTAAADIDCDGDVDLFESNWMKAPPRLQVNQGSGQFLNEYSRLPTEVRQDQWPWRNWASGVFCDVDRDGDNDMFLGGAGGGHPNDRRNWLLLNNGFGKFASAPASALPEPHFGLTQNEAVESECADLDLDGWPDLLVSSTTTTPYYGNPHVALLLNNRDGTFRDATATHLPQSWRTGWVSRLYITDLNRDGWPDIVGSGPQAGQRLFINSGGGRFTELRLPDAFGYGELIWNTIYPIDVDGDGRIDLLMPRGGGFESFWFRNTGP